jgi:hypothetical protein
VCKNFHNLLLGIGIDIDIDIDIDLFIYHLSALIVIATFEPIFGFQFARQLLDMQNCLDSGMSSVRIRMLVGSVHSRYRRRQC